MIGIGYAEVNGGIDNYRLDKTGLGDAGKLG
jgi:hypothetical protein